MDYKDRYEARERKINRAISIKPRTPTVGVPNGLVIVYGHPIYPPYKIEYRGDSLIINGVQVRPSLVLRRTHEAEVEPVLTDKQRVILETYPRISREAVDLYWSQREQRPDSELREIILSQVLKNKEVTGARWTDDAELILRFGVDPERDFVLTFGNRRLTPSELLDRKAAREAQDAKNKSNHAQSLARFLERGDCVVFESTSHGMIVIPDPHRAVIEISEDPFLASDIKIQKLRALLQSLPAALDVLANYDSAEWHRP